MGNIIISKLLVIFVILFLYYIAAKAIIYLLPFILGWIISIIIEPLVYFLHRRLRIFRGLSSFISIVIFVSITGLIITFLGGIIISELTKLSDRLPELTNQLRIFAYYLADKFEPFYITIPDNVMNSLSNTLLNLINNLTKFIGVLATSTLNLLTAIPSIFVFVIVTLISSFFISKDKEKIIGFIKMQFPSHLLRHKSIQILKEDLVFALFGYLKAQLILMSITFIVSSIGLYLTGVSYAVLIALGISIIDAIPVLGSGSVYIPWLIANLILKDFKTALFLGSIYLTVTLLRQTLEPKILGTQIGINPLITLISMYVGMKIFGFSGLILGPIIVIALTAFQKSGLIPKWRTSGKR